MSVFKLSACALLLGTSVGYAQQTSVRLNFRELTAAPEILACLPVTVADEEAETAERAVAETDQKIDQEARRLGITKIGNSFVRGIRGDQVNDAFPIVLDLCSGLEAAPSQSTVFDIRNIPATVMNIAYCASTDSEVCLRSSSGVLPPPPPTSRSAPLPPVTPPNNSNASIPTPMPTPTPAPAVSPVYPRYAFWFEDAAPTNDQDLLKAIYSLRDVNSVAEQAAREPRGIIIAVPKPITPEPNPARRP